MHVWGGIIHVLVLSDRYSYDIYLVHQFFILGEGALFTRFRSHLSVGVIAVSITILIAGICLYHISDLIRKLFFIIRTIVHMQVDDSKVLEDQ